MTAIVALSIVPILGAVALAVDFSAVMAAKTKLDMAADAALFSATATAAQLYHGDPNPQHLATILDQANSAGRKRFKAQAGNAGGYITTPMNVVVATTEANRVITATVTYANVAFTLPVGFFNVTSWSLTNTVASQISLSSPFLNVTMALDNSGSMEIGAEPSDIVTLMPLTACSPAGAYYPTDKSGTSWVQSDQTTPKVAPFSAGQTYGNYNCHGQSYPGNLYTGNPACPILGYQTGGHPGPDCTNLPSIVFSTKATTTTVSHKNTVVGTATTILTTSSVTADTNSTKTVGDTSNSGKHGYTTVITTATTTDTLYPKAGAPCAFACHFDQNGTAGTTQDHFGVARSTIGKPNQVTLRFDLVKSAVKTLLTTMSSNNADGNLQTNIFTVTDQLVQVYPQAAVPNGASYGNDWRTAINDVGAPPTVANGPETGIQPYNGPNGGDTDFTATLSALAGTLPVCSTAHPCDGLSAATPLRVLFIVTDGLNDPRNRVAGGIDLAQCQRLKTSGYRIFVLYTPYYSLMNPYYLDTDYRAVAGGTVANSLRQCASSAETDYIVARDGPSITAALTTFFTAALRKASRLTN